MQLTKQTDYAFRILLYMARLRYGELAQIKQICEFYDISTNHVSKIVVLLSKYGYIKTSRGKNGGISLAMPAQDINLAAVVRAVEPNLQPVNCKQPPCRISTTCNLKTVLSSALTAFIETLANYTLADIAVNKRDFSVVEVVKIT